VFWLAVLKLGSEFVGGREGEVEPEGEARTQNTGHCERGHHRHETAGDVVKRKHARQGGKRSGGASEGFSDQWSKHPIGIRRLIPATGAPKIMLYETDLGQEGITSDCG